MSVTGQTLNTGRSFLISTIGTVRVGDYDEIMGAILKVILNRIVDHNQA